MIKVQDTLSHSLKELQTITPGQVRLYSCGPTVYHFAHIGNLRSYIFSDLLRRVLEYNNLKVQHGMNITDVGHLVGDGDEGEDKLEVGAKREGKHPLEIAKFYEAKFLEDTDALNILRPHTLLRATETIAEQIEIIKLLEEKGFIYQDQSAIYFDTSKLSDYGKLSGQKLEDKKTGAREEVIVDSGKKNPQDFALWFFLTGRYKNHVLHWPSPWGEGFPGWHIECSAISRKILGQPFDIHTGGVDHIGTHHTNEIAQSEAAYGLPLANYWLHGEFLLIDEGRMGKSEGNAYTLATILEKSFSALDFRYLCLTANWNTQLNFTWDSLAASKQAREKLNTFAAQQEPGGQPIPLYEQKFLEFINDNLNTPKAVALSWEMMKDADHSVADKIATLKKFDLVFGLNLGELSTTETAPLPDSIQILLDQRHEAKQAKNYELADQLRTKIENQGYDIKDTPEGQIANPKTF
jgi:cysteinyl-tRNA synthetase